MSAPQVSLDRIRQTSSLWQKIGLDINQALLGSERSHTRSALADGPTHLEMGCSSPPEERHVVILQVNNTAVMK